jgi:hypothetical protein
LKCGWAVPTTRKNCSFIKGGHTNIGGACLERLYPARRKEVSFLKKPNGPTNIGIVVFGNGGGLYPPLEKNVPFSKDYS